MTDKPSSSDNRKEDDAETKFLPSTSKTDASEDAQDRRVPEAPFDEPTLANHTGKTNQPLSSSGPSEFTVGKPFGNYELIEEIARGGMGVVFRARQIDLNRTVALKMILTGQLASDEEIRRFYTEAKAAANLDHANIVPIYEVGKHEDTHYFSMKLIEGSDLSKQLDDLRNDLPKAVALIEKVCVAVHHAHQRGILHRDLKPANILIDEHGEPYVTDLGLARHVEGGSDLTGTGAIVGTPSYMPPEQATGKGDITTAVDVYALGAILYEILTGRPPFQGASPLETLMLVINEEPARPSISGATDRGLEMIALKCLAKDSSQRYMSAQALADDLGRWRRGEPLAIRAPSLAAITKHWMRQNFGRAGWILVVGLVGGTVSGLGMWNATAQQDVGNMLTVYDSLPSANRPFYWMPWNTPNWLGVPFMLVFAAAIALLGYFTALLVRTKNRSADVAAGLIVGVISGAAAFFACLGTLSILFTIDDTDLRLLTIIGAASSDATPSEVLETYPEFADYTRQQQVELLQRKIRADRISQVPEGIRVATIACLSLYLCAAIAGTMVAGPLVRRYTVWWQSLGAYLFCSFPFVATTIVFGLHVAAYAMLGDAGIIWHWLFGLTTVAFVFCMVAESCKWKLTLRIPFVATAAVLFVSFFAFNFQVIPLLATGRVNARRAIQLADKHPDSHSLRSRAVKQILALGVGLYQQRSFPTAQRTLSRGIDYLEATPRLLRNEEFNYLVGVGYSNLAATLAERKRIPQAEQLLADAIKRHPQNDNLRQQALQFVLHRSSRQAARSLIAQIEITDPTAWRAVRTAIVSVESTAGESRAKSSRARTLQALEKEVDRITVGTQLKSRLRVANKHQVWTMMNPASTKQQELSTALTTLTSLDDLRDVAKWDNAAKVIAMPFDPLPVDLQDAFPNAPEKTTAFAVAAIEVDQSRTVRIWLGTDDGYKLWINGDVVGESRSNRQYVARAESIDCELDAGENMIVLQVDQAGGLWKFGVQIEGTDGWPAAVRWKELP